jgi:hypothetical protein
MNLQDEHYVTIEKAKELLQVSLKLLRGMLRVKYVLLEMHPEGGEFSIYLELLRSIILLRPIIFYNSGRYDDIEKNCNNSS